MVFEARPLLDRLVEKIDFFAPNECWQWTASLRDGYGQIRDGKSVRQAHLVLYELEIGPVPDGLDLDHLCRNRACVNPLHLEPVTRLENLMRSPLWRSIRPAAGAIPSAEERPGRDASRSATQSATTPA